MTERTDPAAGEPFGRDYICPQCGPDPRGMDVHSDERHTWPSVFHGEPAAEERAMNQMRACAAILSVNGSEAVEALAYLARVQADVTADHFYREFYSDQPADDDAAAYIAEAQRALRSFVRIATERCARTSRNP